MIKKNIPGIELRHFCRIVLPGITLGLALGLTLTGCGSSPKQDEPALEPATTRQTPPPEATTPVFEETEREPIRVAEPAPPERYVVQRGDTLWGISERFLKDPWRWPEVWHTNPEIRNPHLIFPGDVIVLYYAGGQPYLTLEGAGGEPPPDAGPKRPTVKLKPQIRYEKLDSAIDTIPRELIAPFLTRPVSVPEDVLNRSPYIVSTYEDHLITGTGGKIYARGEFDDSIGAYYVVRKGQQLKDPESKEILGIQVDFVGVANLLKTGDPSTLRVTRAAQQVVLGDRLLPATEEEIALNFFPHPPENDVRGHIIAVANGGVHIGQYHIVILDRGERNGLKVGHVLAVTQGGKRQRDIFKRDYFTQPDERGGLVMVFKTYEKTSYALVMEAYRTLHLYDNVVTPR